MLWFETLLFMALDSKNLESSCILVQASPKLRELLLYNSSSKSMVLKPQGLAQLVRRAHTLSVLGEVTSSSLESSGVRPSARMADGLPPLPSTNVEP